MKLCCVVAVIALGFTAGGCDSSNPVTIEGRALFPNSIGNGPVADSPILILQMEDVLAGPYTSGTTDADGNYQVVVDSAGSVAIIVRGNLGGIDVRISGLTTTGADALKNFNGVTDIACQAAVLAVRDGSITGEQVDDVRIINLEGAAAEVAGETDFLDPESVTRSAETVRMMTNDGAVAAR